MRRVTRSTVFLSLTILLVLSSLSASVGAQRPERELTPAERNPPPQTTDSPEQADWMIYEDDEFGFTIGYPRDWVPMVTLVNQAKDPGVVEKRILFVSPAAWSMRLGADNNIPSTSAAIGLMKGEAINIDVFPNAAGVDLEEWFSTYQAG